MSDGTIPAPSVPNPTDSRAPVPESSGAAAPAFGRFRLTRKLGTGSYGEVWRADDLYLAEPVALKFLSEVFVSHAVALDELKKEVRTLRRLSHPNIVRVHDLVFDSKHTAIVMEYIDGCTLADILGRSPSKCLRAEDIDPWLPQLASVFDYLHRSEAIIHSDIKPVNLMLTTTGRLKVADFGLAGTLSGSTSFATKTGARPGTIAYMSPQQMRGARPSVADDIYSLGATLFHLLAGSTPFHGNSLALIEPDKRPPTIGARRHESGISRVPAVPEHWESAVAACLAKDPRLRPSSVRDVVRWLRRESPSEKPHELDTSVILPPAAAKATRSPGNTASSGWKPLEAPDSSPPAQSAPAKSPAPPIDSAKPPSATGASSGNLLWIFLLVAGLLALAGLAAVALRYF